MTKFPEGANSLISSLAMVLGLRHAITRPLRTPNSNCGIASSSNLIILAGVPSPFSSLAFSVSFSFTKCEFCRGFNCSGVKFIAWMTCLHENKTLKIFLKNKFSVLLLWRASYVQVPNNTKPLNSIQHCGSDQSLTSSVKYSVLSTAFYVGQRHDHRQRIGS